MSSSSPKDLLAIGPYNIYNPSFSQNQLIALKGSLSLSLSLFSTARSGEARLEYQSQMTS